MPTASPIIPSVQHSAPGVGARWVAAAGLAVLVALSSWAATSFMAWAECFFENNECAATHDLQRYRGRLFDYEGRPAPRATLSFRARVYGEHFQAPVRTDDRGRFCVLAVQGRTFAYIEVPGQRHASQHIVRSTEPVDARFTSQRVRELVRRTRGTYTGPIREAFIVMEPIGGSAVPDASWAIPLAAHNGTILWNARTDAAPRCERVEASPPWYRFEANTRSWQYAVLTLTPLLTLATFVFAIAARRSALRDSSARPAVRARRALQLTWTGGVASVVLFVVLWDFV